MKTAVPLQSPMQGGILHCWCSVGTEWLLLRTHVPGDSSDGADRDQSYFKTNFGLNLCILSLFTLRFLPQNVSERTR